MIYQDLKIKYDIVEDGTLQLTGYTAKGPQYQGLKVKAYRVLDFNKQGF